MKWFLASQQNILLQAQIYQLSTNDRIREIATKQLKMFESQEPAKVVFYQDQGMTGSTNEMLSDLLDRENIIYKNPNILINSLLE